MEHLPFNPTNFQRGNLLRLAAHLDLGVTNHDFDMGTFFEDSPECGTVACACGHGPSLGIQKRDYESYFGYSGRAFGAEALKSLSPAYTWLFSDCWIEADNTPRGAAARIYYALKHGIPVNYKAQMWGVAPLSYTVSERVDPVTTKARVKA